MTLTDDRIADVAKLERAVKAIDPKRFVVFSVWRDKYVLHVYGGIGQKDFDFEGQSEQHLFDQAWSWVSDQEAIAAEFGSAQ